MPRYQLKRYSLARKRDITRSNVSYISERLNGGLEITWKETENRERNENIMKKNI